jgi:hypothetical protein
MARIRSLKPEFWSSPGNNGTDPWVRLLYQAMWNWADDFGRGTANVRELAAFAFPFDDDPIAPTATELPRLLTEVQSRYSVVFYEVAGRRYYAILSWENHNRNERRAKSKYPGPEEGAPFDPDPPDQPKSGDSLNFRETPDDPHGSSVQANGSSGTGTGEQGNRGTGENTLADVLELHVPQPEPARKPLIYSDAFEAAWAMYERKGSKKTAFAEWQRAVKRTEPAVIVAAIPAYVASKPDPQYRKDFERWLKGDCWESAVVHHRSAVNGYQPYQDPPEPADYYGDL